MIQRLIAFTLFFFCFITSIAFADEIPVYTLENPPTTPALEDLPLQDSVTQHGITWYFSEQERVGRFVNGDYYVVGDVTIIDIDPAPENGRNGSVLNPPPGLSETGFDSRTQLNRYESSLRNDPPIDMSPGDSLVSSISLDSLLPRPFNSGERCESYVGSMSILTCLSEPVALSAFRPSYLDTQNTIYYSHNLNRDLLPKLQPVPSTPELSEYEFHFQRPWFDAIQFGVDVPCEYMPSYGREVVRAVSMAGLLLMLDFDPEAKEPLLIYFTQYGIDLFGIVEAGHPGWPALGGHGNGRKLPIVLTGKLLNNDDMKYINDYIDNHNLDARFSEDMQTLAVYDDPVLGKSWTGADVVFAGHSGKDGHPNYDDRGAYEHLHPSQWPGTLGESYRRCCTSIGFVGESLVARLIDAIDEWDHNAFFDYADRWMTEPDADNRQTIYEATGHDVRNSEYAWQGQAWDSFVEEMWAEYRYYIDDNVPPSPPQNLRILENQ